MTVDAELNLIHEITSRTTAREVDWRIVDRRDVGPPGLMTLDASMSTATGPVELRLVVVLFQPGKTMRSPDHPVSSRFSLSVSDQSVGSSFTIKASTADLEEALFDLYLKAKSVAERSMPSVEDQAEALLQRLRPRMQ